MVSRREVFKKKKYFNDFFINSYVHSNIYPRTPFFSVNQNRFKIAQEFFL